MYAATELSVGRAPNCISVRLQCESVQLHTLMLQQSKIRLVIVDSSGGIHLGELDL